MHLAEPNTYLYTWEQSSLRSPRLRSTEEHFDGMDLDNNFWLVVRSLRGRMNRLLAIAMLQRVWHLPTSCMAYPCRLWSLDPYTRWNAHHSNTLNQEIFIQYTRHRMYGIMIAHTFCQKNCSFEMYVYHFFKQSEVVFKQNISILNKQTKKLHNLNI